MDASEVMEPTAAEVALIRSAMASGAACFMDKLNSGQVDLSAPMTDAFGDLPRQFLIYRQQLLDDARRSVREPSKSEEEA